jgi:hypothetical protein
MKNDLKNVSTWPPCFFFAIRHIFPRIVLRKFWTPYLRILNFATISGCNHLRSQTSLPSSTTQRRLSTMYFNHKLQLMRHCYPNMKEVPIPNWGSPSKLDALVIHHDLYTKLVFHKSILDPKSMCLPAQVYYCGDLTAVLAPVQHLEPHQVAWVGNDGTYYVRLDYVCTANPECAMVLVALPEVWNLRNVYRVITQFQYFATKQEEEDRRTSKVVSNLMDWLQQQAQPSLFHVRSNQLACDMPFCKFAVDDKLVPPALLTPTTTTTPSRKSTTKSTTKYRVLPPVNEQGRPQLLMAVPVQELPKPELSKPKLPKIQDPRTPALTIDPNLRDTTAEAANLCPPPAKPARYQRPHPYQNNKPGAPKLRFTFPLRAAQEPDLFEPMHRCV